MGKHCFVLLGKHLYWKVWLWFGITVKFGVALARNMHTDTHVNIEAAQFGVGGTSGDLYGNV